MNRILISLIIIFNTSCVCLSFFGQFTCEGAYVNTQWSGNEITRFPFKKKWETEKGVKIDGPRNQITENIDDIIDGVMLCLKNYGFKSEVRHCGIRVKVVESDENNMFKCGKLLCRGAVQNPGTAVVTEDLSGLPHELVHIITGQINHDILTEQCGDKFNVPEILL